ncbi:MAG: hypothetical protein OXF75_03870 [Acidimicrobiaceae bacterium]|nr:hypothetical protein [Acidimicrobiaceae bacterium]
MRESRDNETLKIREPYDPMFRAMFLVSAAIIAALGIGFGVADLLDSSRSGIERIGATFGGTLGVVVAYGLWRADLELRINNTQVTARAWPFPGTVVPILASEVVKIDPLRDYGGWGLKGTRRDRLVGGGGTKALRITYTHESGEERKLTFLTERADQADAQITDLRSR